jgi:hypothetical protein
MAPMEVIGALFYQKAEIQDSNGGYWCPDLPVSGDLGEQ